MRRPSFISGLPRIRSGVRSFSHILPCIPTLHLQSLLAVFPSGDQRLHHDHAPLREPCRSARLVGPAGLFLLGSHTVDSSRKPRKEIPHAAGPVGQGMGQTSRNYRRSLQAVSTEASKRADEEALWLRCKVCFSCFLAQSSSRLFTRTLLHLHPCDRAMSCVSSSQDRAWQALSLGLAPAMLAPAADQTLS